MDYKKINDNFYSSNFWGIDRSEYKWFSKYVKAKVLRKFIKGIPNRNVLYDAGGGVGNWGSYFSKYFQKTIISDISKIALDRIPEKNFQKIKCSVLNNKLPANSVDCILLIDVFEHIDEKDLPKMLEDFKRILKPEGRLLIFTSHYGWGFGAIMQRLFQPQKKLFRNEYVEGHVNRLNFTEFKNLFKDCGLSIEDYYFYSIFFQQITDLIKDKFAVISSKILRKKIKNKNFGRTGQEIKESLRAKETSHLLKIILFLFSYISYLDVLIFGKCKIGNSIFFNLRLKKSGD